MVGVPEIGFAKTGSGSRGNGFDAGVPGRPEDGGGAIDGDVR